MGNMKTISRKKFDKALVDTFHIKYASSFFDKEVRDRLFNMTKKLVKDATSIIDGSKTHVNVFNIIRDNVKLVSGRINNGSMHIASEQIVELFKEETVTCECGTVFPMEYDISDEDGNHTCPSCVRSYFEGRLDDAEKLLKESIVQIDHLDTRDKQIYSTNYVKKRIKIFLANGDEDVDIEVDIEVDTAKDIYTQCPKCYKDRIGRSCHDCQQYW